MEQQRTYTNTESFKPTPELELQYKRAGQRLHEHAYVNEYGDETYHGITTDLGAILTHYRKITEANPGKYALDSHPSCVHVPQDTTRYISINLLGADDRHTITWATQAGYQDELILAFSGFSAETGTPLRGSWHLPAPR